MCIEGKTIFSLQQDDRSVCQCLFKTLVLALESHANPHQPELLAFNCLLPLKQNRAGQDSAFKKDNASPRFCLTPSRLKEIPLVPALYDKHRNGTVPHLQQHWWFIVSLGEYQCCEATRTKCQRKCEKPSETKQRNPFHKLQPTMSKIPTGNVLMELFSKASLEVKTSWTHNQARIPVQTQVCYSVQRHQEMPKDCRRTVCFLQSQYLWQGLHSNRLNREVQKQHREHERVPVEAVNKA